MASYRWVARAFNSDLSYQEMIARPIPMGPWKWHDRDKVWWYNLASVYEACASGRIKLHLIESGPNEVGGQAYAGGAGDPRQFAVSMCLTADHEMDSNEEREWERLQTAFMEVLLPSLGATDIRETESIEP
ncbi:MAG TPA: hypothetical protein VJA94_22570 [Candidatus Angelobacter sp.]